MIPPKKILIPVDFSECSNNALLYAVTLAHQFAASLIVAHIVPDSSALPYAFPVETLEIERQQVEKAEHEIEQLVPPELRDGLDLQTLVKAGAVEPELLDIV